MSEQHAPRTPKTVDVHVGTRIRLQRQLLKMSQEKLGDELGVTFQQVQKYERGANRVGASRLWDLSKALNTPISFFFEGLDQDEQTGEVELNPTHEFIQSPNGIKLAEACAPLGKTQFNAVLTTARALQDAED